MCYKCNVCGTVVHGKLRKHIVQRWIPRKVFITDYQEDARGKLYKVYRQVDTQPRSEIVREVPICADCEEYLKLGIPLAQLMAQGGVPVHLAEEGNSNKKRRRYGSLAERLGLTDLRELVEAVGTAG